MGHLSNLRIDCQGKLALGFYMRCILSLPLFALPLIALTACATFPQVDAVASKTIGPRPALLTLGQLTSLTDPGVIVTENGAPRVDELREKASGLRSR